jgi:hypothetical protein
VNLASGGLARSATPNSEYCELHGQDLMSHLARFHANSSVTPAGVRGFMKVISSAVMAVTIRL